MILGQWNVDICNKDRLALIGNNQRFRRNLFPFNIQYIPVREEYRQFIQLDSLMIDIRAAGA